MTSRDKLDDELDALSVDVSRHLMEHHHRLVQEFGAHGRHHLRALHPGRRLVAGVRACTQSLQSRPARGSLSSLSKTAPA